MSEHDLSRVSDEVLASELARLAQAERNATASLVAHLAEFDARRLYLGAGFPSLFAYSREVLRPDATYSASPRAPKRTRSFAVPRS